MSLIHQILSQRVRHLLKATSRSDDSRTRLSIGKRSRNRWHYQCDRRCPGGEDPHNFKLLRQGSLPVGNRSKVPLLHIWLRLNDVTHTSSYATRQLCLHRLRLRQQSMLDNVRQVIRIHWTNFRSMLWPAPSQIAIANQVGIHPGLTWLHQLRMRFDMISKSLESALTNTSPTPDYAITSAAMGIFDPSELIEEINSALIEHIIDHEANTIARSVSLAQLGLFYPE